MDPLKMFGENIALLIGILTCLGLGTVLFLVVYVTLRATYAARRSAKGLEHYEMSRRDAQGRVLPPIGHGICQQCGRVPPHVYFLADGTRLCRDCLDARPSEG